MQPKAEIGGRAMRIQFVLLWNGMRLLEGTTHFNVEITRSAKDSIAMNTFTISTALFLPGTYIPSLFSMSRYILQADSQPCNCRQHLPNLFDIHLRRGTRESRNRNTARSRWR